MDPLSHELGLTTEEVRKRQKIYGENTIHKKKLNIFVILFRQLTTNPLIIILGVATFISYLLGQHISSYYIFGLIIASILLGFWNEYSAARVIENLLKRISPTALVIRDNEKQEIPVKDITVGDLVIVTPGSIIPADIKFLETKNLEINESVLTGESAAIRGKKTGHMGTSVVSGWGKGVVLKIGKETEYGKIAQEATFIHPITDFQKGLTKFGSLILRIIIVLTIGIFIVNAILGHNILESLLFSLAIAIGLTPELLPVIVTVSLAHGAGKLAKNHVVAKQLIGIENLGNMDILCTDKTGTLTEGKLRVVNLYNAKSEKDEKVLLFGLLCNDAIVHHKIIGDSINTALWEYALEKQFLVDKAYKKIDEEPFDYTKRAMFCVVEKDGKRLLIAKGAPEFIISHTKNFAGNKKITKQIDACNKDGIRVIAIATGPVSAKRSYDWEDVKQLQFVGFITLEDLPKKAVHEALSQLKKLHVDVKIITGDNEIVTQKIAKDVGLTIEGILTGLQIESMKEDEFDAMVGKVNIFARINPQQKLKIIQMLQLHGHTVGYLGDGINDIPSLRGADVGISVNTAVDVAKESASIVLLRKSLSVIADGIIEGRKTFSNTMKYILMSSSSNFGNMFSAAGASFFLSFLPMTPVQILLTNGLYDISQTTIPTDNVDTESFVKPKHWDIGFIKNYMLFFGPLSSIFDFLTFGIMLYFFHAKGSLFQTGWFIESVLTEILVIFVIRTARTPFWKSMPSIWLLVTSLSVTFLGLVIPFTPLAAHLGFTPLPPLYFAILVFLVTAYLFLVETVKSIFLKRYTL